MAEAEAKEELKGADRFFKWIDDLKKVKKVEDKEKLKEEAKAALALDYVIAGKALDSQELPDEFIGRWDLIKKNHTKHLDEFLTKGGMPWVKRNLIKLFIGNSYCHSLGKIDGGCTVTGHKPKEFEPVEMKWGEWVDFMAPTKTLQMMRAYLVDPTDFEGDDYESGICLVIEKIECGDTKDTHIGHVAMVRYRNKEQLITKKMNYYKIQDDGSHPTMYRIQEKVEQKSEK